MEPTFETPEQVFSFALKGNQDAMDFAGILCAVLHTWDDLEDRDKPITRAEVDAAFWGALVVLPRNRFYQDHFTELNALLASAILNWHCANSMERTDAEADKRIAFIVRSDYINVVLCAARLVGGMQWALHVAPILRRYWHAEGWDGYLKNLREQLGKEGGDVLR